MSVVRKERAIEDDQNFGIAFLEIVGNFLLFRRYGT